MKLLRLRYVLPVLALVGAAYAIYYSIVIAHTVPPEPNQLAMPAESPYPSTVAGSALVEANTRNVAVASFESGVVDQVPIVEGQWIAAGEPVFVLDRRLALSALRDAEQDAATAVAQVEEAKAILADRDDQYRRVRALESGITVTEDRLMRAQFALQAARTAVAVAEAQAKAAASRVETARVSLDRLTVRAPVAGRVLKVSVRPGEFVAPGGSSRPARAAWRRSAAARSRAD
ncbi:MAG: hypothetical protein HC826_01465 [Rhodospirillales bacterium]|nr:hypothetical protein [Rhodospirillales bacterium]